MTPSWACVFLFDTWKRKPVKLPVEAQGPRDAEAAVLARRAYTSRSNGATTPRFVPHEELPASGQGQHRTGETHCELGSGVSCAGDSDTAAQLRPGQQRPPQADTRTQRAVRPPGHVLGDASLGRTMERHMKPQRRVESERARVIGVGARRRTCWPSSGRLAVHRCSPGHLGPHTTPPST